MNQKDSTKHSKLLSLILRHRPETIRIKLDGQGWVEVSELLKQMNAHGKPMDMKMLESVVETNNKNRFSFNEDKSKIRANQGHSVDVDLGYITQTPPSILYHGTASRFVTAIYETGAVQKMNRHHVHLSADITTATAVGKRHGKLVIFSVDTTAMVEQGFKFYVSANDVWLVDEIPTKFLTKLTQS